MSIMLKTGMSNEQPAVGAGGTLGELQELRERAGQVADQSLQSTRNMLLMCEESKEAGIRTLVTLDEQGEQLDQVNDRLDRIEAYMRAAAKNLSKMEKCCGLCVLPWKRRSSFKEDKSIWKDNGDGKLVDNQPQRVADQPSEMGPHTGYIARITNDAREEEMEKNMGEVHNMVGNLRNMAIDIGSELTQQNRQIEQLQWKTENNVTHIDEANQRTKKLLES